MKTVPVYSIKDFREFSQQGTFYASPLKVHIRNHDFTNIPHKHDFFMTVLFTAGKGIHEIDFETYTVKPGALFLLRPGQMHNWKLSVECDGYIFFHTRDFYEEKFTSERLSDYPFYSFGHSTPLLLLKDKPYRKIKDYLSAAIKEYQENNLLKLQKLHALANLIYIELARLYPAPVENGKENYLDKLKKFEELIDLHFKELKTAQDYAALMNITDKHLNRISKTMLHKTSTDLISGRVVLEAKRMLIHSRLSVAQIAYELGFTDNSYFNRFFKKRTGDTPLGFAARYPH